MRGARSDISFVRARLAGIEGVRGLAAMMVVAHHVWGHKLPLDRSRLGIVPLDWLLKYAWSGVTIFFVLSGFLLYRPFIASSLRGSARPSLRRYGAARLLRILPAFWLVLLLTGPSQGLGAYGVGATAKNFFLLQIYSPNPRKIVLGPAWTLCLEVAFYAALPLIALGAARWARAAESVGSRAARHATIAVLLLALGLAYSLLEVEGLAPLALPSVLALFAIGILLATFVEWWAVAGRASLGPAATRRLLAGAVLVALVAIPFRHDAPWLVPGDGAGAVLFNPLIALATALTLAAMLLSAEPIRLARFFSLRWMTGLGVVSYGIYLWNMPFVTALGGGLFTPVAGSPLANLGGFLVDLALVSCLTIGFAAASWFAVERHALALKDRFGARPAGVTLLTQVPTDPLPTIAGWSASGSSQG